MTLKRDEVLNIAHLARLGMVDDELQNYQTDLNQIMNLVDQMQEVDTEGIDPLSHPIEIIQRLREDAVSETNQREELQQNAPAVEMGFFKVPKVIE